MSTFVNPSVIAREALAILEEEMVIGSVAYRGNTGDFAAGNQGDTVTIRRPATFTVNEFTSTISKQAVSELSTSITLEKHFDVSVSVTSKELKLSLDDLSNRLIRPAMIGIANKIDEYLFSQYKGINNVVGDASKVDGYVDIADAVQQLDLQRVSKANRLGFVDPYLKASLLSMDGFTAANMRGSTEAVRRANLGEFFGIDWYSSSNIGLHSQGSPGGTPTATGTAGASSVTVASGGNAGTYNKGDIVSFAGDATQYVVTANCELTALGAGTLYLYPRLATSPSGALITQVSCSRTNMIGDFSGLSFVIVPLDAPLSGQRAYTMSYKDASVRVVWDYDIDSKAEIISFDCLVGAKVIQPEKLLRLNRK